MVELAGHRPDAYKIYVVCDLTRSISSVFKVRFGGRKTAASTRFLDVNRREAGRKSER